jgi:hypothetical protein
LNKIESQLEEMDDTPTVKRTVLRGGTYIQVLGLMHEPVLDLNCTEALNLAMRLVEEAGTGLNTRLADFQAQRM